MIKNDQLVLGLYAIHDTKNGFLTPTPESNDASAIRNFAHACRNTDSLFFSHPADYDLVKIAEYYPETGFISAIDKQILAAASDFVKGDGE